MGHILWGCPKTELPKVAMRWTPSVRRKRGGPQTTWPVMKELEEMGLTIELKRRPKHGTGLYGEVLLWSYMYVTERTKRMSESERGECSICSCLHIIKLSGVKPKVNYTQTYCALFLNIHLPSHVWDQLKESIIHSSLIIRNKWIKKSIHVTNNIKLLYAPLNLSSCDLSFFSFFTSFFPRLLSSDIFSFIILMEFCTLLAPLVPLVPSTASYVVSDNQE